MASSLRQACDYWQDQADICRALSVPQVGSIWRRDGSFGNWKWTTRQAVSMRTSATSSTIMTRVVMSCSKSCFSTNVGYLTSDLRHQPHPPCGFLMDRLFLTLIIDSTPWPTLRKSWRLYVETFLICFHWIWIVIMQFLIFSLVMPVLRKNFIQITQFICLSADKPN